MAKPLDIRVVDIGRDAEQPRKEFNESDLLALGQNMNAHGQQVPVIVYDVPAGDSGVQRFVLLDGERRWRAAQFVGIDRLMALVLPKKPSTTELHLLQMSLEAHKVGLSVMERSHFLARIRAENNWSVTELAEKLHMKQPLVSKLIAYQKLAPPIQEMLHSGELDMEKAFIISQEPDAEKQNALLKCAQHLTREQFRQKSKENPGAQPRVSVAKFPLPGLCVIVQGAEVTLTSAIGAMVDAAKELKKAQSQGLDIVTAQRVMRDRAKIKA